ncbi:MAG: RlmE family RNA methyltransferase [Thermodesulfobacteriaceae bacterium]|nr:RlmE family RNA methyltransferase [Thermodesulfobacteriaceae bacterium]MDW8135540.1 RlmE family RNA methyltransferase [Thermodesulfobacterium sp.]
MSPDPWFDKWAKKAKELGYPARSVFKLIEIQEKFKIIQKGDTVLDLGASPGSWSKYTSQIIGEKGKVIGVDLEEIKVKLPNLFFLKRDVLELNPEEIKSLGIEKVDVILSDLAPKTMGDKWVDHLRSVELVEKVLELSLEVLKEGGHLVAKVFEGAQTPLLKKKMEKMFQKVKIFKPKSSRRESKEIFFIAQKFQGKPN